MVEKKEASTRLLSFSSIFVTKKAYKHVADEFHPFHRHDLNVLLHLFTTGLGVWGAIQLAVTYDLVVLVHVYALLIALTTPWKTATLHTAFVYGLCFYALPMESVLEFIQGLGQSFSTVEPVHACAALIALGYGLQDLAHWLCVEQTYMGQYLSDGKWWMLVVHSVWLMPLVIDAVLMRYCFLPCIVSRNRIFVTTVASRKAIENLREWISQNVPSSPETTHLWPHRQEGTKGPTLQLENDSAILAGFRTVFQVRHFDVMPVQDMNEIYVTAVGAKKEINSDAVFYTPHNDGPYWWLPWASLYRVLVGVTPNEMVRTRFNLQDESQDHVLDMYHVLGFDYNRELHWIDHVPGAANSERRSVMKLHYVVYPRGWHRYGRFCAQLNTTYNTWARNNFLRTLRPSGMYEYAMAWWIWLTTWFNAMFEMYFGWSNLVYVAAAYAMGSVAFLIMTSFRHYAIYVTTFAFRQPPVAHGFFMRDAKLYKTISMMHLGHRLLPLVQLPQDLSAVLLAAAGFGVTVLATARLGMVRTYFGSELGFVKPKWIEGFPYGTIPHPMIVGQLFAFATIMFWWWDDIKGTSNLPLLAAHMTCYAVHMVQEMLHSSY